MVVIVLIHMYEVIMVLSENFNSSHYIYLQLTNMKALLNICNKFHTCIYFFM